tara:strand:+ start:21478 stop:21690 length:213 start_codon:yes stop_codon:yes gene_type:complete
LIATHHGVRNLNYIPRLMPDHLMRKLAEKGGFSGCILAIHLIAALFSNGILHAKAALSGTPVRLKKTQEN